MMNTIFTQPNKLAICLICLLMLFRSIDAKAQLPVKVTNGHVMIDDGSFMRFPVKKYIPLADSLDKVLKINPKDTTSLFSRAAILLFSNDILAKPYQRTKGALENLVLAKNMAERAVSLNMQSFKLKVLRAQIYKELVYRFTGDESWMFNSQQIAVRKKDYNRYKEMVNKCYDELIVLDKNNAYDYQKLKVSEEYPL